MRSRDWEIRLAEAIEAANHRPWAWGEHDCCQFALRCVRAMGVEPPFPNPLGRYRTKIGAMRAISSLGATDVEGVADLVLPRVAVAFAGRGDVVSVRVDEGGNPLSEGGAMALGILDRSRVLIAGMPRGLAVFPRSLIANAWRVE